MTITAKTFPGVYTQIVDKSFLPETTSRFKPGLIGVASKGPFDTPINIRSLSEFVRIFGSPVATTYSTTAEAASAVASTSLTPVGFGSFLADAVAMIADMTNGIQVVRVGNRYKDMPVAQGAFGSTGNGYVLTNGSNANFVQWMLSQGESVYIAVSEADSGKRSSINLPVTQAQVSSGTGTLTFSAGYALTDTYQNGIIQYSTAPDAAWSAESTVYGYGYNDVTSSIGAVTSGVKGQFSFQIQSGSNTLDTKSLYAITDANGIAQPTYEFRIQSIAGNTVNMVPSDNSQVGYQAVSLQDSYTNGKLWKVSSKTPFLTISAASAGIWANSSSSKVGLYVAVRPGSKAGTKKLEVYWNSSLVETFDNLSFNPASSDYYTTRINGVSSYINIDQANTGWSSTSSTLAVTGTHAANTAAPWDFNFYGSTAAPPTYPYYAMPYGAINAGYVYPNVSTAIATGSQFINGANGENASTEDFVGVINADDTMTGLKCFLDVDNVKVNLIAAPMDDIPVGIMQELRRVAKKINAFAIADVPAGYTVWDAIDWHNGSGKFTGRGRIDDSNLAVFWNWITITSTFDGTQKMVPPTLAVLRCMASTWLRYGPWYAAAGVVRGKIDEALAVEFDRISDDAKQAMYGNGNSINPIWKTSGQILVWGDRTMQVAESKLSAIHSVNLVNWIVTGLGEIAKQYVFDPNDQELLSQINLSFTEYLDKILNERGMDEYALTVDTTNNTDDSRNRKEVNVDLSVTPLDVAERINLNVTVNSSGATLNSVS